MCKAPSQDTESSRPVVFKTCQKQILTVKEVEFSKAARFVIADLLTGDVLNLMIK